MRNSLLALCVLAAAGLLHGQAGEIGAANTAHYAGSHRWAWTVYLLADSNVLGQIRCVEYRLDPTFPSPVRQVCQKGSDDQPFALSTQGWGEFTIHIKVMFAKGTQTEFEYDLKLVETACTNPFDQFTLTEGQSHPIQGVCAPPVYIFADEIYTADHDSHFRLFRTNRFDSGRRSQESDEPAKEGACHACRDARRRYLHQI